MNVQRNILYRRYALPPKRLLILLACKQIIPYLYAHRLPEGEPLGLKHVEDIVKIKILL